MSNPTHAHVRALLASALFRCIRAITASILVYCGLALAPSGASAGSYHVYSCRMPDGQAAPTDGWTSSTSPASATVVATDTCSSGGALIAALGDGVAHEVGASATWTLSLPSFASLKQLIVWRAGDTEGGEAKNATYQFVFAGPSLYESFAEGECIYSLNCKKLGESGAPLSLRNILDVPQANLGSHFYVTSACGGLGGYVCPSAQGDLGGDASVVYLYSADVLIEQTTQPTIAPGTVAGELATASKLSGTASVTFEASDAGSGIYQAIVEVDEQVVGSMTLDSNGGRCADVGQTTDGLPAFLYLQPCAPAVSADVSLNTTPLSNGVHHIVVSVSDAAGNRTVVMDRKVEVANAASSIASPTAVTQSPGGVAGIAGASGLADAGLPNGSPSTSQALLSVHWRSTAKAAIVGRWGRSQTILGKLTSATGAPISGATVEVAATPSAQGARATALGTARTAADGTFSVRVSPHSSSELIVVAYRAHSGDPVPAAASTLMLRVPASLTLRVAPRVSHAGGTIVFSGVVHGGHIPSSGKQIVLQAHAPGAGWRTFQVLSTNRRGRYRASYRFRLPGPITYRFRAVSRQEADFPFASGNSNVATVFER